MTKPKSYRKRKIVQVEVEKGIPLPPIVRYPWNTMEIGDSFIYQGKSISAGAHIKWAKKQFGKEFTQRHEGTVIRIWRIDPNQME